MTLLLSLTVGVLGAVGVRMLLKRDVFHIVAGAYLVLNMINLLIMGVGWHRGRHAPFGRFGRETTDPLAQAMVLTAIVIGLAVLSYLAFLAVALIRERGHRDVREVREWRG